jgi:hypothetical protein
MMVELMAPLAKMPHCAISLAFEKRAFGSN